MGEPLPADFEQRISVEEDCPSLTEYLRCFELPLRWLQTPEGLKQAVIDLLHDCQAEHTRYIEIRFAPTLHLEGGLSYDQVYQALEAGKQQGEAETGVRCAFLVCAMRHHSQEQNLAMLEAASRWFPALVCGADLAGDENAFPTALHTPFFRRAGELGIPYTIHSGETGNQENIRTALALGADRLGHGIAMQGDGELIGQVKQQGVGVELCPTSNFQTKASRGWEDYPLRAYLEQGVQVCLNTDNRTVSRTTLNREYLRAAQEGGCSKGDILTMLENACRMSFAPEAWKQDYLRELEQYR
jgi:adenosine deaminase